MIHEPDFLDAINAPADDRPSRLVKGLREHVSWNDFASSLVQQYDRKRSLSDKQLDAAERMLAKIAANRAEKAARAAAAPSVDLTRVHAMFAKAMASGHKRPVYRAAGLALSLAPLSGRNAGSIYVKDDETGDYLGKVTEDLRFNPLRTAPEWAAEALSRIARDPSTAAVEYGRETGRCSCCGRELTNPDSIALGIGPICKDRWGF
jgi:hypothetical protein